MRSYTRAGGARSVARPRPSVVEVAVVSREELRRALDVLDLLQCRIASTIEAVRLCLGERPVPGGPSAWGAVGPRSAPLRCPTAAAASFAPLSTPRQLVIEIPVE